SSVLQRRGGNHGERRTAVARRGNGTRDAPASGHVRENVPVAAGKWLPRARGRNAGKRRFAVTERFILDCAPACRAFHGSFKRERSREIPSSPESCSRARSETFARLNPRSG